MELDSRKEIVFFYESIRANPNGDPGFDNHPRMYPDNTVMVTDVRIKRTIRDYAKKVTNGADVIFVDYGEDGKPVKADDRAKEILIKYDDGWKEKKLTAEHDGEIISTLLCKTFDVPLFGALVTIRPEEKSKVSAQDADEGEEKKRGSKKKRGSAQITGPCQFGMGKSVNEAEPITVQIAGRFVGDEDKGRETTLGTYSVVDYALIKTIATINPANLELEKIKKRLGEKTKTQNLIEEIKTNFVNSESKLLKYLWAGTNGLVSRSKFQQRSILAIEVEYDRSYSDLDTLVGARDSSKDQSVDDNDEFGFERLAARDASKEQKHHATDLVDIEFGFKRLIATLEKRAQHVRGVRIACDPRLDKLVDAAKDAINMIPDIHAEKLDLVG